MDARLPAGPDAVTERQREVARLVAEGRTNPEIAAALGISLDGAKYHVSELLGRLALQRREDIAAWYRAQQGSRIDRARRRLRAAFGLPLAWGAGRTVLGVASVVFVGAVVVTFAALFADAPTDESPVVGQDPAAEGPVDPPGTLFVDLLDERGHLHRFAEAIAPGRAADLAGLEPLDLGRSAITSASPDGRFLAVTTREPGPVWPAWSGMTIYDLTAWNVLHTIDAPPDLLRDGRGTWSADGSRLWAWREHCPGGANRCHPDRWERELWEIDVLGGTASRVAAFDFAVMAGHVVPPNDDSPGRAYALAIRTDECCLIDPADNPFIAALDLATGEVIGELPLPGLLIGQPGHWLGDESRAAAYYPGTALAPEGSRLYVVDSVEDRVIVVDLEALRVERTVDFETPRSPLARLGDWLWSRFASTAEAKGGPYYSRQAEVTPDGRYLLITGSAPREGPGEVEGYDWTSRRHGLVVIDTATLAVASMHPTILGWGFAVSPDGRWLVGSADYPDPDASGDDRGAWVGNGVQVIDLRSLEMFLHLWPDTGVGVRAISPNSRYAYLMTAGPGAQQAERAGERCEAECRYLRVLDLHRGEIVAERVLDHEGSISLAPAW